MDPLLIARFAQAAAAVVLVGTLLLRLFALGSDARDSLRWSRLVWGCWGTLIVAGVGVLGWTTASMTGRRLTEILHDDSLRNVLTGTHFGAVWLVRSGLLMGLFIVNLVMEISRRRMPVTLDAANLLLAAAVLVSLVWTGHARASAQSAWLLPIDGLHVLAAGAWPGGLLPLAVLLVRARKDPTLLRSTATIVGRFSRSSAVAVAVLGFSGLLNAMGTVGGFAGWWPGALWTHVYGRLLLCKVALFAAMVSLGAFNQRLVRRTGSGNAAATLSQLCWNVGWEGVLAVGVILATEALAMSIPPR